MGNATQIFEFSMNDPIFSVQGIQYPTKKQEEMQNGCSCCGDCFKNAKDAKQCHFCALSYCSKCRYKTRAFPKANKALRKTETLRGTTKESKKDKDSQEDKGDICKVCDRKFFIKEMLQDKNLQIEAQVAQLLGPQGLNAQMETSKQQLLQMQAEYDKERKLYALDYQKIQLVKEEMRKRLKKVKKKNEDIEAKNLEQIDR